MKKSKNYRTMFLTVLNSETNEMEEGHGKQLLNGLEGLTIAELNR